MLDRDEQIKELEDKLKRCKCESDRYWKESNRHLKERDVALTKLKQIQEVLDGLTNGG